MTLKATHIVPAFLLALSLPIHATEGAFDVDSTDESEELHHLLELLEEQTTLATKTRLNADYVPGMITVLHGEDMENRGVRTVWEALALVPGLMLSIEEAGRKQVVFRGLGRTYSSGNAKILLNGVSMNTAHIGHANPVMNIPIEQVERVEVIRGPGSAIHGEFALIGVINVITRQQDSKLFAFNGENNTVGGGAIMTYTDDTSPLVINLNLGGYVTDGPDVLAGRDELFVENGGANAAYSNSPGHTNEAAENRTSIFSLNYDKFSLIAHWLDDGYGDHFGRNQMLPDDEKRIVTRNKYKTIEVKQGINLSNDWTTELYAGWQDKRQAKDDLFAGPKSTNPVIDTYVDFFYREYRTNVGADFRWTDDVHQVLVGIENVQIDVEHETHVYKELGVAIYSWAWVKPDKKRYILSTTLQDEWRYRDDITVTIGLRNDHYNDIDSELSPRLAAVWRKDQNNIFKFQFARAFRPPTWYEMAAAIPDPVSGTTIHTVELGYIRKNINNEFSLTMFNSRVDQFIVFVDSIGFKNTEDADMQGAEFEFKYDYSKNLNIDGNISYLESDDHSTGQPLPGSADWIGNIGIHYRPVSRTNLAVQYHYVGETYRESTDSRGKLESYETVDATLSFDEVFGRDTRFRVGIKNLFNEDVRYPAPVDTYVEDHPRARRQWWMQFVYDL